MPEKEKINRLRVVLADKEISHKEFAKMVSKTPNTITRICNNEQQPSLKVLREMAIALDVDVCELIVPTRARNRE
ncbi:MAG TPA: helix-turn-helix transcriptional regulator [Cyclobacteriaceae bacterium]|jgi:transcriptional regulator with XRE-family HTH domain|nr:helix-turn-helix transcriptional regulator [Cyclobacteriaceae bacterium]